MHSPPPITMEEYWSPNQGKPIKLHLGCGGVEWKDFTNVDLFPDNPEIPDSSREGCVADVCADMRDLGLPDASVEEIFSSHGLEHFTRWIGIQMLNDWYRMLKEGGILHVETPDFWRSVLWLFHPRQQKRESARPMFFGNQWDEIDYETHRYLWTARELKSVLVDIGFSSVTANHTTVTHHPGRDIKAICVK